MPRPASERASRHQNHSFRFQPFAPARTSIGGHDALASFLGILAWTSAVASRIRFGSWPEVCSYHSVPQWSAEAAASTMSVMKIGSGIDTIRKCPGWYSSVERRSKPSIPNQFCPCPAPLTAFHRYPHSSTSLPNTVAALRTSPSYPGGFVFGLLAKGSFARGGLCACSLRNPRGRYSLASAAGGSRRASRRATSMTGTFIS